MSVTNNIFHGDKDKISKEAEETWNRFIVGNSLTYFETIRYFVLVIEKYSFLAMFSDIGPKFSSQWTIVTSLKMTTLC